MRAIAVFICAVSVLAAGCTQGSISPISPSAVVSSAVVVSSSLEARAARSDQACWGEATEALARLGQMGYHASHQDTPRLGLANVARLLYEAGVLADDSLQALGAFLSSAFGLSIESCL